MKILKSVVAVLILAVPALAGDRYATQGAIEFACSSECPLAKTANTHRSFGQEDRGVSEVVRADLVRVLEKNLERI